MGIRLLKRFGGARPWAVALVALAAALLLPSLPAWAAGMSRMTLEILRQGEPTQTHYLEFYFQSPMAQYILRSSNPPERTFKMAQCAFAKWHRFPLPLECSKLVCGSN